MSNVRYPEKGRYSLTRKIALCWFKIIADMPRHGSLIREMKGKTLIGDFVGCPTSL
jgi:hypothetical protein